MALIKSGFKTNLVSFWRQNRRRRGEEEKREEEERKEEEEEEEQAKPSSKKVWNFGFVYGTNLDYGFYEIWHGSLGLYDD